MPRLVGATRPGCRLSPRILYGDDAVLTGPQLVFTMAARVERFDERCRHLAAFGMPKADAGSPVVEVEDLLPVHAGSPVADSR